MNMSLEIFKREKKDMQDLAARFWAARANALSTWTTTLKLLSEFRLLSVPLFAMQLSFLIEEAYKKTSHSPFDATNVLFICLL
jgi:hypothetical protein